MRVGLVFHHDPRRRPPGIDLERLTALAAGLSARGALAEIVAPVDAPVRLPTPGGQALALRPLAEIRRGRYQILKTCYHPGVDLVQGHRGPLVCRLVRVVDQDRPARDAPRRERLLAWQAAIHRRADAVAFNNPENLERWRRLYGWDKPAVLTPTGCPETLPPRGPDPYAGRSPAVVFLGSLASGRMTRMLNRLAQALRGQAALHLVGLNKSGLYGDPVPLSGLVVDHGPQAGARMWDLVAWADFGLALAAGPEDFDNDSSKVYTYLRAGLPVLCEQPIRQWPLIAGLGMGRDFPLGDLDRAVAQARALLADPPPHREAAMARMAAEQAWGRRVDAYLTLFRQLLARGPA
ncbi:MAG: hypothetical protein ACOZHQ_01665 [Thermodesulfobacteriota bacterium]